MRCVAIVRFPAPAGLSGDKLHAVLEDAVPRYLGIPGLQHAVVDNDAHSSRIVT